jgi:hypothetical protein
MSGSWNVVLGSLWRTFKVQGRRTAPFVKTGTLDVGDGTLQLTTKYDPPGSGWLGAGAAIVTGIIVVVAAQQLGFCAGPGWLFWFIGIAMLRRRTVSLDLREADAAHIDPANRRMAFHINFEGKPRWVAIEAPENFDAAVQAVSTQLSGRVYQDNITRALTSGSIALIVLASLSAAIIALGVVGAFIFMMRRPPARNFESMIFLSCWAPVALSLAPVFSRRTRCTSECRKWTAASVSHSTSVWFVTVSATLAPLIVATNPPCEIQRLGKQSSRQHRASKWMDKLRRDRRQTHPAHRAHRSRLQR